MKRIFALLVSFLLLFIFVGCNNSSSSSEVLTGKPSSQSYRCWLEEALANAPEGEFKDPTSSVTDVVATTLDGGFEYISDIVTAIYKSSKQIENGHRRYYFHEFQVTKNIFGNDTQDAIYVVVEPHEYAGICSTYEINYKSGAEYLLLLRRDRMDQYKSFDVYRFPSVSFDSMTLPLNNEGEVDLDNSTGYNGRSKIKDCFLDLQLRNASNGKEFLDRILALVHGNSFAQELDFIDSEDVEEILSESEYIFMVKSKGIISESYCSKTVSFVLLDIYKGEYSYKNTAGEETISIQIPVNSVSGNGTYIIAANSMDIDGYFEVTSRNSIFSYEERDNIKNMLD